MVKEINKDISTLTQRSEPFDFDSDADAELLKDLLDTAYAHKENCAGLAAIQIGVPKRLILVRQGNKFIPFINPIIINKSQKTYLAEEGCLSVEGQHWVRRHHSIKVLYSQANNKTCIKEFNGFTAEIIQHEVDHCNGILI